MTRAVEQKLSVDSLTNDTFSPHDFRVSHLSLYQDKIWDFRNSQHIRLKNQAKSKLVIDWEQYAFNQELGSQFERLTFKSHLDARVSTGILEDIRFLCFVQLKLPATLPGPGVKLKESKPQTVTTLARALLVFISVVDKVRRNRIVKIAPNHPYIPIQSLTEVTLDDLEEAIEAYPFKDGKLLQKALKCFTTPILRSRFKGASMQWTADDIRNLNFPTPTPRDTEKVMPDALFRLLSNKASEDVAFFADALGRPRYDKTTPVKPASMLPQCINLSQAWEDYVEIRAKDRLASARRGKRSSDSQAKRSHFERTHGLPAREFHLFVQMVRGACLMLLGLYTGCRFSDFTSFFAGCIQNVHGMPMLTGTETKHQDLDAPENNDIWPAIPILQDAVDCLKELSRVTYNPYLICNGYTVAIGEQPGPMSINGFRGALIIYLRTADTDKRWSDWVISPHQLRQTVAHKLAQADVGIVYISYQLKHLYTAISAMPADVTLRYGNIGELKLDRAMAAKDLHRESANALFNPNSPIAGRGADDFRQRRKVYFDGRIAEGWTEDEIIDQLAACGSPFMNVAAGYCGGVRDEILEDGTKQPPPCLGSLKCNAGDCSNAVVTKIHAVQWMGIVKKNKELASDPRLAHAADSFEAAISTGERVLRELGIDPATL